jgi:hypothetical protein
MEQLDQITTLIALSMGVAWASGINLYAALLMLGLLGSSGNLVLPPDLQILTNPLVIFAAGAMYLVEFAADKVPGVDNSWDTLHTFIRIPAGAMLAAGAVGEMDPAVSLAAAIVGGGLAAGAHATKAGSRVLINTSPEPFSNWMASLGEDIVVIAGLWTALNYPVAFICLLLVFVLLMVWLLPKIWQGVKFVFTALVSFLRGGRKGPPGPPDLKLPKSFPELPGSSGNGG